MLDRFLRSTPFRLTVVLASAFIVALLIGGGAVYLLIQRELNARVDGNVLDTYGVIKEAYGEGDLTDLVDSVASHVRGTFQDDRVYLLIDRDGKLLAGNATIMPPGKGLSTLNGRELGLKDEENDEYRVNIGVVDGLRLMVGASYSETREIGWLILTSLSWAGVLFLLLVLAAGLLLASRGQRRLDSIAETMRRVGRGELQARIATSGRGDDVDALIRDVNAALDRLASLVEGMRQVSVDIAHDLKTPLNRLAITVESAIEADGAGKPVTELLAQAQEETLRINAIFDALLRIAQIESGARRSRFTGLRLASVIEILVDIYGEVAKDHGQNLIVVSGDPFPEIIGDKDLLTQMLANLIENAIRHCPPGSRIAIESQVSPLHISVIVADDGPGISEDERGKVFQRLYRTDKSRTSPGNGLGLSLVKAIAELHGGTASLADNRPGLRVVVNLPLPTFRPDTGNGALSVPG
jgi:signal transduction histidine kinase